MEKIRIGKVRGDETAEYNVPLPKVYTVEAFVDEVLKDKWEWGEIKLKHNLFGKVICSFSKGIRTSRISDEYKDKKVVSAKADGGWSLMNYILELK